jgi:single-stranded-DNA-specific exonuclease
MGFNCSTRSKVARSCFTRFGGHAFAVGFAMPRRILPHLKLRLRAYAQLHLAMREPEHVLRIHAELSLDRITPVLAGWLRKLEPLGHGNPEPIFLARNVRLVTAPRTMKERHVRLDLTQASFNPSAPAGSTNAIRAVGWDLAARAAALGLTRGSLIDIAYKIRENDHPEFGGLEVEIAGMRPCEFELQENQARG